MRIGSGRYDPPTQNEGGVELCGHIYEGDQRGRSLATQKWYGKKLKIVRSMNQEE